MTSRDFCFWLQGYLEISAAGSNPDQVFNLTQVDIVQRHLALVFKHEIDPSQGSAAHQAELNATHSTPAHIGGTSPSGAKMRC